MFTEGFLQKQDMLTKVEPSLSRLYLMPLCTGFLRWQGIVLFIKYNGAELCRQHKSYKQALR